MSNQPLSRPQLAHRRQLFVIVMMGIFAVVLWIGSTIIHNLSTTTISAKVQQQVQPLTPFIDEDTLKTINNRRFFSSDELQNFPVAVVLPTPTAGPTGAKASPRPTLSPAPSPK